ncbi:MAG: hypothetical protein K2M75_03400 [Clostridia bacterium]|nr:hypothetical protein [Clostridia bacterium]
MKKVLSCITVVLCVLLFAACFTACASTNKYVTPEFSIENQGYTVEFLTNMEKDFDFPIKGLKLNHANFERERCIEYSWIIKNAQGETVGWLESDGGYDFDKKGNFKFGYSPSTNNGVYSFGVQHIVLVLQGDISVFDGITMQTNCGTISKADMDQANPYSATQRYMIYDQENNIEKPMEGSQGFVCYHCELDLTALEVKDVNSIKISFNIPNLTA